MGLKIVSNSGSGNIVEDSVISYSYSEDVTSLNPAKLDGGVSQFTMSAIEREEDTDGVYLPNSKLLINNVIEVSEPERGNLVFQVKNVSTAGSVVTMVGDTVQGRLNVEKTAEPFYLIDADPIFNGTLGGALTYYCSLCGVEPFFDIEPGEFDIPVNFIGWTGNVWDHLKMICSGITISDTDNVGIEMYVSLDQLCFRKALNRDLYNPDESLMDISQSVDAFKAAATIDIYNYNTEVGIDRVVYDIANYEEGADPNTTFLSSISDSMQVEAGQTIKKTFTIDGSLTSVNQPVCVSTISSVPYSGTTGEYVIVGNDDLPVLPEQWLSLGGKIEVALGTEPNTIDITVTAPVDDGVVLADGSKVSYGPYRIGVETSGDNVEYPAFFITGTGVFYNKKKHTFYTGSDTTITSKDIAQVVDNPFITNTQHLVNRGVMAAQDACGPNVMVNASLSGSTNYVNAYEFSNTIGRMITKNSNRFRINNISFAPSSTSFSAISMTGFAQFNANWGDATFATFDETALPGGDELAFNEFTVLPLIKGA